MHAAVIGPDVATPIAVKASDRVSAARLQFFAQHVTGVLKGFKTAHTKPPAKSIC
jgi:hypothetical protein